MHYYVVGVNGSGKTSLLNALAAETGIEVIHGTAALMRHLGISGDYAALRAMDQEKVLSEWGEMAARLVAEHGDQPFLLDTHILNLTKGKVIRRDGDWIARYDALILIKARPATILARIRQDAAKDRALFPAGMSDREKVVMLEEYQAETEQLFRELSARYGLPSLIIQNDSSLSDGVAAFINSPIYK